MRVVFVSANTDIAGCGIAFKRAFDAAGHEARSISRRRIYFEYDTDIVYPFHPLPGIRRQVESIVSKADVVHFMDTPRGIVPYRPVVHGKRLVVHYLGTNFRRDPEGVSAWSRANGMLEATDSIDLLVMPQIAWLPIPANLDALARMRQERHRRSRRIRIAHAPTDRIGKSTDAVLAAVASLSKRYPIDFDLIERVTNRECLDRKAQADIIVDQLHIGFGLNAIESWGMGIPVVSGLSDLDARWKGLAMWGRFPWADATEATLETEIERLVADPQWRRDLGQIGRAHAERWHSQAAVVEQAIAVYERSARVAA